MLKEALDIPVYRTGHRPDDVEVTTTTSLTVPQEELNQLRYTVLQAQHAMAVAALNGDTELLRRLLATGIQPAKSALLNAVIGGHVETARCLMWRGSDPNDHIPSLWSYCQGNEAMRSMLVERGLHPTPLPP
jgi:hypothetical protein